jgi:PAS domain S-box-containing protein
MKKKQEKSHRPVDRLKAPAQPPNLEMETFGKIFAVSPIGIYVVQDGKFRIVNPEFQTISGYGSDELLAMAPEEIVFPDDRAFVRNSAVKSLKGGDSSPYVFRAESKAGEIKWIIETVTPIRYDGRRATLGYFMDSTEHERAKEALRLSEDKFHKAFRSSPDWVAISTLDSGLYIDVNEAFLSATGYRPEEVRGRTSIELGIWADPGDRDEMVRTLQDQGVVRNRELKFRMKSGEIRYVLWSAEVMEYGDEKCLIAVTRDITDRKRAEEEQLKREKLQGALETAGAACHELNQPLQYIYYLLDEITEEFPDNDCIQKMKTQIHRIREITGKLEGITTYETANYVRGAKILDLKRSSENR